MTNGSFIDDLQDIPGLNALQGRSVPQDDGEGDVAHDNGEAKPPADTFPCESCGGTGLYRGVRRHQVESKCFSCGGKGWFKTSYKDRLANRAKAGQRKVARAETAQAAYIESNPGVVERLREIAGWSDFGRTLLQAFNQWNCLTEKQTAAAINLFAKIDAKRAEKAAAQPKSVVDPSAIRALFDVAHSNGLKKPGLWFGDIKISEAPAHGVNAGALYVKRGGDYAGKIVGNVFKPIYGAESILTDLLAIAANPAEILREKGKQTGVCCCCGRELSDPVSVAAGIGPICASNWGL